MKGRPSQLLTLSDLQKLTEIVQGAPTSLADAARMADIERARLSRLIQRVNTHIGENLSWRHAGRFSPPLEARRIAAAFARFDRETSELKGSPRISAGSTVSLLLIQFFQRHGESLEGRPLILRSQQVIKGLRKDQVDLAFIHSHSTLFRNKSIRFSSVGEVKAVDEVVEATAVVAWKAQCIRTHSLIAEVPQASLGNLEWETGSLGAELTKMAGSTKDTVGGLRVQCYSFFEAMELVCRGAVPSAIIPDLYLQLQEADYSVEDPPRPVTGYLTAVYRTQDRERWQRLVDPELWRLAVSQRNSR